MVNFPGRFSLHGSPNPKVCFGRQNVSKKNLKYIEGKSTQTKSRNKTQRQTSRTLELVSSSFSNARFPLDLLLARFALGP